MGQMTVSILMSIFLLKNIFEMKRILIIVVLLSASWFNLFAQDLCGTPAITSIENVKKLFSPQRHTASTTYALRIYFHVIRSSSGTGD